MKYEMRVMISGIPELQLPVCAIITSGFSIALLQWPLIQ